MMNDNHVLDKLWEIIEMVIYSVLKGKFFPFVISVMIATVDRETYQSKKYGVQSSSSLLLLLSHFSHV